MSSSTLYMPIASPPTPAPSPGPSSRQLPSIASFSRHEFAILPPAQRRQYLTAILNDCTPDELSFVSTTIAPLLKRDFLRDLPPELAIYILSFFDEPLSLLRCGRVSRYWNSLVLDEWLWKRLCDMHDFRVDEQPSGTDKYYLSSPGSAVMGKHSPRHPTTPLLSQYSYRSHFKQSFLTCKSYSSPLWRFHLAL